MDNSFIVQCDHYKNYLLETSFNSHIITGIDSGNFIHYSTPQGMQYS